MASSKGTSPSISGPAGSYFESQVGGFYVLSLLSNVPARGLPGVTVKTVAFQQANTGYPLDDVVIHGFDTVGGEATLEIQVKRSITFAPSDPVFKKVVAQIVESSQREDFYKIKYELAIAVAKTTTKIESGYQDRANKRKIVSRSPHEYEFAGL